MKSPAMIALRSDQVQAPPSADAPAHKSTVPLIVAASVRRSVAAGRLARFSPRGASIANELGFVAWEMLLTFIPYPLRRAVRGGDTESSKSGV